MPMDLGKAMVEKLPMFTVVSPAGSPKGKGTTPGATGRRRPREATVHPLGERVRLITQRDTEPFAKIFR